MKDITLYCEKTIESTNESIKYTYKIFEKPKRKPGISQH